MSPLKYISREFQNSRRVLFNLFWYGSQLGIFAYGWHSQVIFASLPKDVFPTFFFFLASVGH